MKKGFTLAEVLITLGIIGIVAALTIPTLIANYQKQVYVTQLKKFYNVMQNALIQIEADTGCVGDLKCTGIFDDPSGTVHALGDWYHPSTAASKLAGEAFAEKVKVAKNCGSSPSDCFPHPDTNPNLWSERAFNTGYSFITADGMSVIVWSEGANCSGWDLGINYECGELFVDVNANKPPNVVGRDQYTFMLFSKEGILPFGSTRTGWKWKNNSGDIVQCIKVPDSDKNAATYCSARTIEEGWEMNY